MSFDHVKLILMLVIINTSLFVNVCSSYSTHDLSIIKTFALLHHINAILFDILYTKLKLFQYFFLCKYILYLILNMLKLFAFFVQSIFMIGRECSDNITFEFIYAINSPVSPSYSIQLKWIHCSNLLDRTSQRK